MREPARTFARTPRARTIDILAGVAAPVAALGLFLSGTSPAASQAADLGTAGSFAVLAGAAVTNTGSSVLTGDLGVFPGAAITGFPPGSVAPPFATYAGNAVAGQAQIDLVTAYNALAGRPATADLTGQDLGGGRTLTPGVYNFNAAAQLTGPLTLNAQGNPNAVFIFNIGSSLTTASASTISLIGGAQGKNVFFRVGSSATLGTATMFVGDILALTSITLNNGASITCGAALARNGAVTLDTNNILIPRLAQCMGPLLPLVGPTVPGGTSIPPGTIVSVLNDAFAANGTLPPGFLNLTNLSAAELASALTQITGEAGTGLAPAGFQAMNSFLRLVLNPYPGGPFADDRFASPNDAPAPVLHARGYLAEAPPSATAQFFGSRTREGAIVPDARLWNVWGAAYGGQSTTDGSALAGTHDRSIATASFSTGMDYRVSADTVVGFALAGGGTDYSLSGGLGGGHTDMGQAALYSFTRFDAAYVSAALAYAGHWATTDRQLSFGSLDRLRAKFFASDVGGRIESGYRFAVPGAFAAPLGFTPYAAAQIQAFWMPSYSETEGPVVSAFALRYDARTATTERTELGAWLDQTVALDHAVLVLRARAAWAHDYFDNNPAKLDASFVAISGSPFAVRGANPTKDAALLSAGAWVKLENRLSFGVKFDGEFASRSQTYAGTGVLRYTW